MVAAKKLVYERADFWGTYGRLEGVDRAEETRKRKRDVCPV
jgi:hypothetical protein